MNARLLVVVAAVAAVVLGWAAQGQQNRTDVFRVIRGSFVIEGKQPDGDSVRFIADDATQYKRLAFGYRVKPSKDGSVQLRFEAIDAPEAHYLNVEQPLGRESRDALLSSMGFKNVQFEQNDLNVSSATPASLRGAILARMVEVNGRPVSYAFLDTDVAALRLKDGASTRVSDAMLARSLNSKQVVAGWAYVTLYTSTPASQQAYFVRLATTARTAKRGIWAVDKTAAFELTSKSSLGRDGALILPKLFRRAISYLNAKAKGDNNANIKDWIVSTRDSRASEDDVVLYRNTRRHLSDLLVVNGNTVQLNADPLALVFVEK